MPAKNKIEEIRGLEIDFDVGTLLINNLITILTLFYRGDFFCVRYLTKWY
jgi:hypothetical protein